MAPFTSFAVENDELFEIQKDNLHLTTEHHYSLLDNFNAILHGNIFGSSNGKFWPSLSIPIILSLH